MEDSAEAKNNNETILGLVCEKSNKKMHRQYEHAHIHISAIMPRTTECYIYFTG
jgi:CDP-diacylglycerol pyrophosphatase